MDSDEEINYKDLNEEFGEADISGKPTAQLIHLHNRRRRLNLTRESIECQAAVEQIREDRLKRAVTVQLLHEHEGVVPT